VVAGVDEAALVSVPPAVVAGASLPAVVALVLVVFLSLPQAAINALTAGMARTPVAS
jgi:hypothetical protein